MNNEIEKSFAAMDRIIDAGKHSHARCTSTMCFGIGDKMCAKQQDQMMAKAVAKQCRQIAKLAFPEWRGRKVNTVLGPSMTISGTFWDGGTRSEFKCVELATGRVADPPVSLKTPTELGGSGSGSYRLEIPEGFAIVEHSIFCGKDVGCTVYLQGCRQLP